MTRTHLFSIVVIAFAIVGLAILIWGFDKGFDVTDVGFYVLRYQQNQPSEPSGHWFEHIVVKTIIPPSWRTIKSVKYLGLFINLLSTIIFAWAISITHKKMHGHRISFSLLVLMMLPPIVHSVAGLPSGLSYNTLNQLFLIISAALLLLCISYDGVPSLAFAALAAGVSSMLYLAKLPTGLVMSLCASLVLLFSGADRWRRLLTYISSNLVFLFLWSIVFKPNFILKYYDVYINSFVKGSHYSPNMLLRSITETVIVVLITFTIAILISTAFWLFSLKRDSKIQQTVFLCIGVVLLTVYCSLHVIAHLLGYYVLSQLFLMVIFLMIFTAILQHIGLRGNMVDAIAEYKPYKRFLPLLPLLIVVPYLGAFGAYFPMDETSKYYFASFMGAIALLIPLLRFKYTKLVVICLSFYLTSVGLYHYIEFPFKSEPLYKQTVEYKGIKYDPETAHYLKLTEETLTRHGFNKEQGLIVAYGAPGIVYLMGSYHPGGILWAIKDQDEYFRVLKKCHLKLKPLVISIYGASSEVFVAGFNDATGLDFYRDYWLVDPTEFKGISSPPYMYFPYAMEMPAKSLK
ncbi:MAG: hypothetical protein M0P99_06025 [Candidatus Cloacimonetes bacterium]|nr:hypothetical protein [Candidatus Cloacimonadota bacterium]